MYSALCEEYWQGEMIVISLTQLEQNLQLQGKS